MKTLVESANFAAVLKQWRGADAKIWVFHVTHNRLAIYLHKITEHSDCLYVVGIGCRHISGPFSWKNANISIVVEPEIGQSDVRYHLIDEAASFELHCESVGMARGPGEVPPSPFENFLGDLTSSH